MRIFSSLLWSQLEDGRENVGFGDDGREGLGVEVGEMEALYLTRSTSMTV